MTCRNRADVLLCLRSHQSSGSALEPGRRSVPVHLALSPVLSGTCLSWPQPSFSLDVLGHVRSNRRQAASKPSLDERSSKSALPAVRRPFQVSGQGSVRPTRTGRESLHL